MANNDFLTSLIGSESGGNWSAQNNEIGSGGQSGHFGRLQFGHARLQDAMDAGIIPSSMTPSQFMADPTAQQAVEAWHFADIDRQSERMGLNAYVGQTIGGAPITPEAIRAMAHLGGIGGAAKFLKTGGQYNPSDAYGTSLLDYAKAHGGAGGSHAMAYAPTPRPRDQNPALKGIMQALLPDIGPPGTKRTNSIGVMPKFGDLANMGGIMRAPQPKTGFWNVLTGGAIGGGGGRSTLPAPIMRAAANVNAVPQTIMRGNPALTLAARTAVVDPIIRRAFSNGMPFGPNTLANAQRATSQSGDTSVGNQAEAAATRASAQAWRDSRN